jgi:hypothetical protein
MTPKLTILASWQRLRASYTPRLDGCPERLNRDGRAILDEESRARTTSVAGRLANGNIRPDLRPICPFLAESGIESTISAGG